MLRKRRLLATLAALLGVVFARWLARAGDNDQTTFRISVNRVQLEAAVTDAKGHPVTDLKPDDFRVLMDGKEQQVTACSYIRIGNPAVGTGQPAPPRSAGVAPPPSPVEELRRREVQRTIVFLIDDGSLKPDAVLPVRKALAKVIEQQVQPGDLTAVIRTMSGEGALEQFTSDKRVLLAAVDRIRWLPIGRGSPHMEADDPSAAYLGGVSLSKAVHTFEYVLSRLRALPGKKALVFVSQDWPFGTGFDEGLSFKSNRWNEPVATAMGHFVDDAIRAGVTIYTVDPTALSTLNPGADYDIWEDYLKKYGAAAMSQPLGPQMVQSLVNDYRTRAFNLLELSRTGLRALADGTGGLMVADSNDVSWGMARFFDDLQGYYLIEFRPGAPERFYATREGCPPPFHNIRIQVKVKGLHARYHRGFVGWKEAPEAAQPETAGGIDEAIASPFPASGIRLRLTAFFQELKPMTPQIEVLLYVDARDVAFTTTSEGRHHADLELVARTLDEKGEPAESVKKTITLELLENTFQEAQQRGLLHRESIPVAHPGYYEVRIVARDSATGKMGSARQYVDVPDLKNGQLAMSGLIAYRLGSATAGPDAPAAPELRVFERSDTLGYACQIFNAKPQSATGRTAVETETRVFQEGKPVLTAPPSALSSVPDEAVRALAATGSVPLSSLEPGSYALQLIAHDPVGRSVAAQWIDFSVAR